jgi:nucleotide-binding universal stress UspA family protein
MKKILVAIDNSLAAKPVLAAARAVADVLGAELEAVHVRVDGEAVTRSAADAAGVPLRIVRGEILPALCAAGDEDDVVAVVIGARGLPTSPRPLGGTATAVATTLPKPVVVVPPDAEVRPLRRILVPLEGDRATSLAPGSLIEIALDRNLEVVVLHVIGGESIPAFTDQPQHEQTAWAEEFLARYCPAGIGSVALETRVGRPEVLVPITASRLHADLVALGWSQQLAAGHAPVVRATLELSQLPVMLVPVGPLAEAGSRVVEALQPA